MGNIYFLSVPVSDKQNARTLGAGSAWEILHELRKAGIDGLTAEEISKKLDLPESTVYSVLSKLQAAEYVERRRARKKLGRPNIKTEEEIRRTGRTKQIYVEKINWGGIILEEEFNGILDDIIGKVLKEHQIVDSFADAFDKVLVTMAKNEDGKGFLPSAELCPQCIKSHEADEFVWAIGIGLVSQLLSREFFGKLEPILRKHNVHFS